MTTEPATLTRCREAGAKTSVLEWVSHQVPLPDFPEIDSYVTVFSDDEMSDFVYLVTDIANAFIKWGTIAEGFRHREVLFAATTLHVARSFLSTDELRAEGFQKELMLAILGFKTGYTDDHGFDPSVARGYLIERILTNGINVDTTTPEYFRWLDMNHEALSRHSLMLRQREAINQEFMTELISNEHPSTLAVGVL